MKSMFLTLVLVISGVAAHAQSKGFEPRREYPVFTSFKCQYSDGTELIAKETGPTFAERTLILFIGDPKNQVTVELMRDMYSVQLLSSDDLTYSIDLKDEGVVLSCVQWSTPRPWPSLTGHN